MPYNLYRKVFTLGLKNCFMSVPSNMNWISTTTNKNGFEFFELWKETQKLMTLELNLFSQTAKIECYSSRRIFKIDKEGFLRHKTILKK